MIRVEEAMRQITALPTANVDRGFGQGHDIIRQQYEQLLGEKVSNLYVEGKFESYRDAMNELQAWVLPYKLPNDYQVFLEYYGGLLISADQYTLMVDGIGPMIHEWYGFPRSDESTTDPGQDGLLQIASLELQDLKGEFPSILFFIDLAGIFQKDSVLGIGPYTENSLETSQIIANPDQYRTMLKVLASSFTEWLILVSETQGRLGYL